MSLAPVFLVQGVSARSTMYSFNLIRPNVAEAPETVPGTPVMAGDTIRITGSGAFDTTAGTATGSGSLTHFLANGKVFARAVWFATDFVSFSSYGGPSPGVQGGLLIIEVTVVAPEATFTGLHMQVSCVVNAPGEAPEEGTTILGLFTEPVSGLTLFHLAS